MALTQVSTYVPFASTIYWRLRLAGLTVNAIERDHRYDQAYLAWETVRLCTNPFFVMGTGFEGYLIGKCTSPESALESLLNIMQGVLDGIARCHPYISHRTKQLFQTLNGEISDPVLIEIWSTWLGVILAQLRPNLYHNKPAELFRNNTYQLVNSLPPLRYCEADHSIKQEYYLCGGTNIRRLNIGMEQLPSANQEAWLVALQLGRFGHPLVRQAITHNLIGTNYPMPRPTTTI